MSVGYYRVAGFTGYPDIYYTGPDGNIAGNAQEWSSTDGTCTGEQGAQGQAVIRASSYEDAVARCFDVYPGQEDYWEAYRLGPGANLSPAADAWYCFYQT